MSSWGVCRSNTETIVITESPLRDPAGTIDRPWLVDALRPGVKKLIGVNSGEEDFSQRMKQVLWNSV
ncbi:hypothetical protein RvY_01978 [Ramazzottius varieornatus]|uniref:Uncharacterized protein n=1 Tax=Ramazzottius varieornatus TaxID=947166 RepID=A0A1D1UQ81_RAMVA|nr:hypothetical protein RvY_01978 [Ramazzottius varieornatus]